MISGCSAFAPLCPASTTMVVPANRPGDGERVRDGDGVGPTVGATDGSVVGDGERVTGDAHGGAVRGAAAVGWRTAGSAVPHAPTVPAPASRTSAVAVRRSRGNLIPAGIVPTVRAGPRRDLVHLLSL